MSCSGAEELGEGPADVWWLLFALGGSGCAVGQGLGGVGDLVVAAAANRAGFLRFGEVGLHQPGQLGEAAEADDAGGALERVRFGAHRLEVGSGGGEAGGDHVAAAFRLCGERLQDLVLGCGVLVHRAIALSTASCINLSPKAPSTASLTTPLRSIVNSHGSLGRWNSRTCGRTFCPGSFPL